MEEIWKSIPILDGRYYVSNFGRVKNTNHKGREKVIKGSMNNSNYLRTTLNHQSKFVHRLVAEAFVYNPFNLKEVNHIDGDKTNNRSDNLEWVSRTENMRHSIRIGIRDKGEFKKKKPVVQKTMSGEFVRRFPSMSDAARTLNCSVCAISRSVSDKIHVRKYMFEHD